jgi:F-type H+-transporting ATPase subunit delta
LEGSKDLKVLLSNPVINSKTKSAILKEIFSSKVGAVVSNFIQFVVDKGRENLLNDICNRFMMLSDEKLNQVNVAITSAVELNELQKNEIEKKLTKIINKNVIADYKINNKIIGGFKAKYNDTVIDASIEHQLQLLKKVLFQEDYLKN